MKWIKKLNEAPFVFALLRVATVLVAAYGTWIAVVLGSIGLSAFLSGALYDAISTTYAALAGLATVAVTSVCCYIALLTFFFMCGRLKRGNAFTDENAAAMRRISLVLFIAGIAVAAGIATVMLLMGESGVAVWHSITLSLVFFGASLLAHALAVLVRRAVALQRESELTI